MNNTNLRYLFIKSNYFWGGPWLSFKYKDITIDNILENSYGKGGHPLPLIALLKMDVFIVDYNDLNEVTNINYQNSRNTSTILKSRNNYKKYMKNIYKLNDIPFENYDVVYTEDELIPKEFVNKHKNILFVFNASEHHLVKTYYDVLIDHKNVFAFPHCLDTFKKFKKPDTNNIYIENRTAINIVNINHMNNLFNKDNLYYNTTMSSGLNPWDMDIPDNCIGYWKQLGNSKYYLQLGNGTQGIRIGQAFVDSACVGCINIGKCLPNMNYKLIHPYCKCDNIVDAANIIKNIENDNNLYNEILNYQNNILNEINNLFIKFINNAYLIKVNT